MARDDRWTWLVIGVLGAGLACCLLLLFETRAELETAKQMMNAYHYAEATKKAEAPEEE